MIEITLIVFSMVLNIATPDIVAIFMIRDGKEMILNQRDIIKQIADDATWSKFNLNIPCNKHNPNEIVKASIQMHDENGVKNVSFNARCNPIVSFSSTSIDDEFQPDVNFCSIDNMETISVCAAHDINKIIPLSSPNQAICVGLTCIGNTAIYGIHGQQKIKLQLLQDNGGYKNCIIQTQVQYSTFSISNLTTEEYVILCLLFVILILSIWIACIAVRTQRKKQMVNDNNINHQNRNINHHSNSFKSRPAMLDHTMIAPITTFEAYSPYNSNDGESMTSSFMDKDNQRRNNKNNNNNNWSQCQNLMRGPCIGHGTFGKLYLTMDLNKRSICMIKQFRLTSRYFDQTQFEHSFELFKQNFSNLLQKFGKHPGIAEIFGYTLNHKKLSIFMPFYTKSSIQQITKINDGLPTDITLYFGKQILQTLDYLHHNGIIHGSLKGSNILIDQQNQIKLTDIGMNNYLKTICTQKDYYSYLYWCSPEIINGSDFNNEPCVDIWSFGMTLIEMRTSKPLWHEIPPIEVMSKITNLKTSPIPKQCNIINDTEINDTKLIDIISSCLQPKTHQRTTIKQLLARDIFNNDEINNANLSKIEASLQQIMNNNQDIIKEFKSKYDMKSPLIKTEFDIDLNSDGHAEENDNNDIP